MQAAVWGKALDGETRAVQQVLRIIEQRCRLLGLDQPGKGSTGHATVIAPGCEAEYAAALVDTQERNRAESPIVV